MEIRMQTASDRGCETVSVALLHPVVYLYPVVGQPCAPAYEGMALLRRQTARLSRKAKLTQQR
jgi:hypothetical protein